MGIDLRTTITTYIDVASTGQVQYPGSFTSASGTTPTGSGGSGEKAPAPPTGGGSGGGNNSGGTPPRTTEASGYYYDRKHIDQLPARGRTTEEVAALPYRALWTADSVDLLRDEPAVVYYDTSKPNQYVVINEQRSEVVQISDRADPEWVVDKNIEGRRTTFTKVMESIFRRSKNHHKPFARFNNMPIRTRTMGARNPYSTQRYIL